MSETLSTCRFAQRMLQVTENAQQNTGSLSSVHGNLYKLDPVMQQYLEASPSRPDLSHPMSPCSPDACRTTGQIPHCTSSWQQGGPSPGVEIVPKISASQKALKASASRIVPPDLLSEKCCLWG